MKLSVFCTLPGCRRFTRHSSGRCHDHRPTAAMPTPVSLPLPVPTPPSPGATYDKTAGRWRKPDGEPIYEIGDRREGYRAEHNDRGEFIEEWFDSDGRHHRDDGPAILTTSPDGTVILESYFEHGQQHRDGAAAGIRRSADGTLYGEIWRDRGAIHRVGGPAEIYYASDGSIEQEVYHLRDDRLDLPEYAQRLRDYPDDEVRAGIANSPHAPLLDEGHDPKRIVDAFAEGVQTLEGARLVLTGTPPEWARAFEESSS